MTTKSLSRQVEQVLRIEMSSGFTKLEVVFRDATDPILMEDLDGIVIDMNEQAVRT